MKKLSKFSVHLLFLASVASSVNGPVRAQAAGDSKTIVITVRLPADAELLIDEHAMQSSGGVRTFQTPPVPVGSHYVYTLKARAQGKEVVRTIHLAHGTDNTFDLRAEFLAAAKGVAPAKSIMVAPAKDMPIHLITINWGASLRTVEQALDAQPADGSRFPK